MPPRSVVATLAAACLLWAPGRAAGEPAPVPPELQRLAALLGQAAPDFSLTTADGQPLTLEQLRDGNRVVIVQMWASWCTPCYIESLIYTLTLREFGEDLAVVGLHANDGSQVLMADTQARLGMEYPTAVASDAVWAAYGDTPVLPTSFMIGRSGRVRRVKLGIEWMDEVAASVRELSAESIEEAAAAEVTADDFDWGRPAPRVQATPPVPDAPSAIEPAPLRQDADAPRA